MIDAKTFDRVAQLSHFGWDLPVILGPAAIWPDRPFLPWWCFAIWTAYAAVKEFVYDEMFESPEVRGSSLKDFAFQVGGAALGLGLLAVSGML